jgi:thymidylate kinase
MNHVIVEGLPAAGKSEILELLARFYPHRVRVLPELVKQLVLEEGIDLFNERARLAEAIRRALPDRGALIRETVSRGYLCLEESHLGVHYAYAAALGDRDFLELYPAIQDTLSEPDVYLRMALPVSVSLDRQAARGTAQFDVEGLTLARMLAELDRWHAARPSQLTSIDADRNVSHVLGDVTRFLELEYGTAALPNEETFDVLLLLGRPASGKSEFIDFMSSLTSDHRAREFFLAPFEVVDDFPILWDLFLWDDAWESAGRERRASRQCDGNYAVTDDAVWGLLIDRINERVKASPSFASPAGHRTTIIEFSRGGENGYQEALQHVSPDILRRAAVLYVSVSFEESWRRNLARYDEKQRDGILTHSVPREEMERTYGIDDWNTIAGDPTGWIQIGDVAVPYATLLNEPESVDPDVLAVRYRAALGPLFTLWQQRRSIP